MPSKYTKEYYQKNKEIIKYRNREYAKTHKQIIPKHDKYFDEVTKNTENRRYKSWTIKETDFVKEYYGNRSTKSIAKTLKRTIDSIHKQARKHNISAFENLGIEELKQLNNLFPYFENKIYNNLNSFKANIPKTFKKLNIQVFIKNRIRYIKTSDYDGIVTFFNEHKLAKDLYIEMYSDMSYNAFMNKVKHLKVKKYGLVFIKNNIDISYKKYKYWTSQEYLLLKNNIDMPIYRLTKLIPNRSKKTILFKKNRIKKELKKELQNV